MAEKINQRVAITKKMLKDSLVELLKTKSIYKISVRELCEKAQINRSTFYKYYGSQFDLLAEMERDIITLVEESLARDMEEGAHSVALLCKYMEDNIELSKLIVNNNIDPQLPEKIFGSPQVQYMIDRKLGDKYTRAEHEYVSGFLTYGVYQVIKIWLNKEKREPSGEIAELILNWLGALV